MKKTLLILAFLLPMIPVLAQQSINWQKINDSDKNKSFSEFGVFKNNKDQQVFISDFKLNSVNYILETYFSKKKNESKKIGNSKDKESQKGANHSKDSVELRKSDNIQPTSFDFIKKLYNNRKPYLTQSYDSNYLIVAESKVVPGINSKEQNAIIYNVIVYNKNLEIVWNDSINLSGILKPDKQLDEFYFEFNNGKAYILGESEGDLNKHTQPEMFVVQYDKPNSGKLILDKSFKHNRLGWKYAFTKENQLIISGINVAYSSPYVNGILSQLYVNSNPAKTMFFTRLNLKNNDEPQLYKEWNVDGDFAKNYPDYKSILDVFISFPSDLLQTDDGVIYCSEYMEEEAVHGKISSTTDHYRPITLVKFTFDGDIKWIKMINKHVITEILDNHYSYRPFVSNGKIIIFYYDVAKNIASDHLKAQTFTLDNMVCLTTALVDIDGNLHKSLIYKIGDIHIYSNLQKIKQQDKNHYLLQGEGDIKKTEGNYNAIFTVQE